MTVQREGNWVVVEDALKDAAIDTLLAAIHQAIVDKGYSEIILDFSQCTEAYPPAMVGVCVQVRRWRQEGISFQLVEPADQKLARHFVNTNWAHLLDPERYAATRFQDHRQIPATPFATLTEQPELTYRVVKLVIGALQGVHRGDVAALEWAVNEIIDNVITHSESVVGGILQVSTFTKGKKIQFVVADAGIGIPKSLRVVTGETPDEQALARAIEEGVTRGTGQGNGLFGSYEICRRSKGFFSIESGHGRLRFSPESGLQLRHNARVPYHGTLVTGVLDLSVPKLLEEALRIKGRVYRPTDYLETHYEDPHQDRVLFRLHSEAAAFGSRLAGTPVRNKLLNLIQMIERQVIVVDFIDVPLLSSSFADEVFGKLFAEVGPLVFTNRLQLVNVPPLTASLMDKAIMQRVAGGSGR